MPDECADKTWMVWCRHGYRIIVDLDDNDKRWFSATATLSSKGHRMINEVAHATIQRNSKILGGAVVAESVIDQIEEAAQHYRQRAEALDVLLNEEVV